MQFGYFRCGFTDDPAVFDDRQPGCAEPDGLDRITGLQHHAIGRIALADPGIFYVFKTKLFSEYVKTLIVKLLGLLISLKAI